MMALLTEVFGGADPAFWMPLACMALLTALLAGAIVFDGFDLGVACLCVFAPPHLRSHLLSLLSPWRDANTVWLLLGFGLFLTAFPHAVRPMLGALAVPLALLALGTLLRGVAFAFHLRAPRTLRGAFDVGVAAGAWLTVIAHGLLLSAFVLQFDDFAGSYWFSAFGVLAVTAAYSLLGAAWLILRAGADVRRYAVRWARTALRWAVAGAVGVCTVLGLGNPIVLARWGVGLPAWAVMALWLTLLASVVVIETLLRRKPVARATRLPFVFTLLALLLVLGGLFYSVFPDLVPGELTVWDAAASLDTLRVVLTAWLVAAAVLLMFNLWVYRGLFSL